MIYEPSSIGAPPVWEPRSGAAAESARRHPRHTLSHLTGKKRRALAFSARSGLVLQICRQPTPVPPEFDGAFISDAADSFAQAQSALATGVASN